MDATETDFPYEQSQDQVGGQVDDLAGGIMDLLEDADPGHSGEAEPKKDEVKEEPKEEEQEEEPEEVQKYTIKWQGQEKEVTQDELINLAQQGYDYTQKTQALSQERDQLAPLQGLATLLKSDPVKAAQIAAILQGQVPQTQKKFEDPIEQLKYETKQEALAEIRQELQQNLVPLQQQQVLNEVRMMVQADPDYAKVQAQIVEFVRSQPSIVQKAVYDQLNQNPQAYMETFQHYKSKLTATEKEKPVAVKRETKAPILASGGVSSPDTVVSKDKMQRLSKKKADALRSGNPMAIGDWLLESGAIDHIL
jgi:hypothetical protein